MSKGKKSYFRHSFFAHEDEKIQNAINLLGFEGYAFYFIILEICARKYDDAGDNIYRIHEQTLKNIFRKHTKSCRKVVEKLQQSGLFYVTFSKSLYEFHIPNLSKYLGSYDLQSSLKSPNKIKENKIKLKNYQKDFSAAGEISLVGAQNPDHEKILTLDDMISFWNSAFVPLGFPHSPLSLSSVHAVAFRDISHSLWREGKIWGDYLDKISSSSFLLNQKKTPTTILWVLNQDNFLKTMSGSYEEKRVSEEEMKRTVMEFMRG